MRIVLVVLLGRRAREVKMQKVLGVTAPTVRIKQLLFFSTMLLTLTLGNLALSADFQKGKVAFDKGDYETALREWMPLAEQGDASSQFQIGYIYQTGQGVLRNYKTAAKWYTLAAEQGVARAQFLLGSMYALGQGVIKDTLYAHMWSNIAASNGYEAATTIRATLEEIMSLSQLEKAQDLARECTQKKYIEC
jgi:TPR repeat protein